MGTPLYNTDIIPLTSRPTLTVMDDGDYFVILDTSTGKISKILKTLAMEALKISYDNTTSGLTAETVQAALDEIVSRVGDAETAIGILSGNVAGLAGAGRTTETVKANADDIISIKGTGYTEGSLKTHEDRLDTLEGTVDTNRLYSDSQYLELKAKYDAQQIVLNASKAELYTDDPILQYGATEIIGKGYEAGDTPIDVSANVVDGKLSMEQKGLMITNLVENGDFKNGFTSWSSLNSTTPLVTNQIVSFTATARYGRIHQSIQNTNGNKFFISVRVKASSANVRLSCPTAEFALNKPHSGSSEFEILTALVTSASALATVQIQISDWGTSGWAEIQVDGTYGCRAYNLTALGLDHITDTDILAKLLPYVDGTKNVGKMGLRVVDDNMVEGDLQLVVTGSWQYKNDETYYKIDPTKPIYLNYHIIESHRIRIALYDANKNPISNTVTIPDYQGSGFGLGEHWRGTVSNTTNVVDTVLTIASNQGIHYIRVGLASGNVSTARTIVQIRRMISQTVATFQPYSAQQIFLPAIGNSLPNGVSDSIKTVADWWEHTKRVSTPASVGSGVAVNTTNYPTAKNGGQWVNELTAGGTEIGVVGTDSTTGAGMLRFELATPIVTKYDLPLPTSGKTIHRFAGEEKIALYGTGLTFSENVLSVLSAVKFVAGVMTDITSLAVISGTGVTFSGVNATDVVYVKVEHDVDRPLGILEHTPAVSNTASRLASLEARVSALEG